MNITIDMVTGEIDSDDIIVISNRYTEEKKGESTDCSPCHDDLQIQQIEVENTPPPSIPVDIINNDVETFINDMG